MKLAIGAGKGGGVGGSSTGRSATRAGETAAFRRAGAAETGCRRVAFATGFGWRLAAGRFSGVGRRPFWGLLPAFRPAFGSDRAFAI